MEAVPGCMIGSAQIGPSWPRPHRAIDSPETTGNLALTVMARRAAFEADGVVTVSGTLGREHVDAMREHVWQMLEAHGVVRAAPATWSAGSGRPLVEVAGALRPGPGMEEAMGEVGRAVAFTPLVAALGSAVDEIFGPGMWAPIEGPHGGRAAPNFPIRDVAWNVPHAAWHVDEPTCAERVSGWGLLGFAFLDAVESGGGATVVLAGSQRRLLALAAGSRSGLLTTDPAIAALTRDEPWLADLFRPGDADERRRRFLGAAHVSAGIPLRVVELTGAPGDLVLMDPRCLHTVSANVSHRARLTVRLTCRCLV